MKKLFLKLAVVLTASMALVAWPNYAFADKDKPNKPEEKAQNNEHHQNVNEKIHDLKQKIEHFREENRDRIKEHKAYKNLNKSEHSRWDYNPRDDRRQGNRSIHDMLDPYGHDKDSDRKALYGNNGRIIREPLPDPEPDPLPDPDPEPDPVPEPEPTPDPVPEPEPTPTPEPEPDPDPIPEMPF